MPSRQLYHNYYFQILLLGVVSTASVHSIKMFIVWLIDFLFCLLCENPVDLQMSQIFTDWVYTMQTLSATNKHLPEVLTRVLHNIQSVFLVGYLTPQATPHMWQLSCISPSTATQKCEYWVLVHGNSIDSSNQILLRSQYQA